MSKFFFKGRIDSRENYQKFGYRPNRNIKPGSEQAPLTLRVVSEQRKVELEDVLTQNNWFAEIEIDERAEEDIQQLEVLLDKPQATKTERKPARNEACPCGSGKKYKQCCLR